MASPAKPNLPSPRVPLQRTPRGSWRCRRQSAGIRCDTVNPNRKRKCTVCGNPKPAKRGPAHMAALEAPYEYYVQITGGERCGICLRPRASNDRKLDRDHDHRTGRPRGLLCHKCNRALPSWVTPEWLRAAADYLERTR